MGVEPTPWGGAIKMYDQAGDTSVEISSSGSARFLRDGSEYMGVEPSPFRPGGDLTMYNAEGSQSVVLSSTGSANFFSAGTEYMGVEPSPFLGGTLKMYADAGTTIILSSAGRVGIGTGSTPNILTIQQFSSTDPIADAWTIYSSRRWKTNVRPIDRALEKVMQLNGVSYEWIENGKHDIGFIAEDVGQVIPEVVAYEENGVDAKSVDYARLTALLIEAVKEQQKSIESYEKSNKSMAEQISNLERRLTELEKR
jgi:hypothetical protein